MNNRTVNAMESDLKKNRYGSKELGAIGELYARRMLENSGYTIIVQNFRCKVGEIDIICKKEKTLVFCEVKSRRSLAFGIPAEAVNAKKINHIRRVASWFLTWERPIKKHYNDFDIRFDVIEAIFVGEKFELNHVQNAF